MSASINVSESDFEAVAGAAISAKHRGDLDEARKLDKIARKINAALTGNNPSLKSLMCASGMPRTQVSWKDMPSVFGEMFDDD